MDHFVIDLDKNCRVLIKEEYPEIYCHLFYFKSIPFIVLDFNIIIEGAQHLKPIFVSNAYFSHIEFIQIPLLVTKELKLILIKYPLTHKIFLIKVFLTNRLPTRVTSQA